MAIVDILHAPLAPLPLLPLESPHPHPPAPNRLRSLGQQAADFLGGRHDK